MLSFGRSGNNLGSNVFLNPKVSHFLTMVINILMRFKGTPVGQLVQGHSRTIKDKIPICKEDTI